MEMINTRFILGPNMDDTYIVNHCSMVSIWPFVLKELQQRYPKESTIVESTKVNSFVWDPGGMMMANCPDVDLNIDEFHIYVNAQYYDLFWRQLTHEKNRIVDGCLFYKIHCRHRVLVVTPKMYDRIVEVATRKKQEAKKVYRDARISLSAKPERNQS